MRSLSKTYEIEQKTGYDPFVLFPDCKMDYCSLMLACKEIKYLEKVGGHYFTIWGLIKSAIMQLDYADKIYFFEEMMFEVYVLNNFKKEMKNE